MNKIFRISNSVVKAGAYSTVVVTIISLCSILPACAKDIESDSETYTDSLKGLKDFYKDYFPVGVAV